MNSKIKILSISDIHLGHHKTSTSFIIDNLKEFFHREIKSKNISLIIFGGDTFDRSLFLSDPSVNLIYIWFHEFLRLCKDNNVIVRIMEGTPSHDWKQNKIFEIIKKISEIDINIKYIYELSIEYLVELDLNILYVPDECKPTTEDIWNEIKKLLNEHKLEKVDISVVHGLFDFKTPEGIKNVHSSNNFKKITKYVIFGAHDHRHAQNEHILINGSFDRLAHGEEENKGFWKVFINKDTKEVIKTFIVNKNAKIYKTIKCNKLPLKEILELIDRIIQNVPVNSFIRIEALKSDPIISQLDFLKKKYLLIEWSIKKKDDESLKVEPKSKEEKSLEQIYIKAENIKDLLINRIKIKNNFNLEEIKLIENKLTEFI